MLVCDVLISVIFLVRNLPTRNLRVVKLTTGLVVLGLYHSVVVFLYDINIYNYIILISFFYIYTRMLIHTIDTFDTFVCDSTKLHER